MTLEYVFTNADANFGEAVPVAPSFGIALVLEQCVVCSPISDVIWEGSVDNDDQVTSTAVFNITTPNSLDQIIILTITSHQAAGSPANSTIASVGLDWELIESVTFGSGATNRVTMWKATNTLISSSVSVSVNFLANQNGWAAGVVYAQFTTGNPIRQIASFGSSSSVASITIPFDSTPLDSSIIYSVGASWDTPSGDSSNLAPSWTPPPPIRPDYLFLINGGPSNDFYNNLGGAVKRPADVAEPVTWELFSGPFDLGGIAIELCTS